MIDAFTICNHLTANRAWSGDSLLPHSEHRDSRYLLRIHAMLITVTSIAGKRQKSKCKQKGRKHICQVHC